MNGFTEKKLPAEFNSDNYNVLIVADKYQTGFDQNTKVTLQLVKADNKDNQMRAFEKSIRPEKVNAAYCQNAFDIAVTHLAMACS